MNELKIVRKLLDELNKKIVYCHWKSNQHFSDALVGIDDLDILIDRKQYNELLPILANLKFKHFYTPEARMYVGIEDYLGFDEETGKIIHLHLHYQLVVGEKHLKGFCLPLENIVLNRRVWHEEYGAYLSSAYDELLLLILRLGMKNRNRDFFRKKATEKNTLAEYEWLKKQSLDFTDKLQHEQWLTQDVKHLVEKCYTAGISWTTLRKMKRILYRDFASYTLGGGMYNSRMRHVHEGQRVILEIKKRYLNTKFTFLRRRPATGGVIIAFVGSDGSGKSSAIFEMTQWLKKVMDVRYFYLGSGDGNSSLLRAPLKASKKLAQKLGIIKITNNYNDTSLKEKNDADKKMNWARELWIYTLAKERIKKLTSAARARMRGFVVLTDRYPQNEFDGLCDGPKLRGKNGLFARKEAEAFRIAELCPPDVAIKLIVSPEVAMQRKPGEINLETSKNLTERVKSIHFSDRTKIYEIDGDKQQEEVWLEIKKVIWESI